METGPWPHLDRRQERGVVWGGRHRFLLEVPENFVELRHCEVRRTPLPSTRVYGALSGTGSSPIHRRVVNFIGPGRGRMGRTDQGLLRRIVLREALAARLADSCSIGRGICGATLENAPSTHSGELSDHASSCVLPLYTNAPLWGVRRRRRRLRL